MAKIVTEVGLREAKGYEGPFDVPPIKPAPTLKIPEAPTMGSWKTTALTVAKYATTILIVVLGSMNVHFTEAGVPVLPSGGVPWWGYLLIGVRIVFGMLEGMATADARPTPPPGSDSAAAMRLRGL